MPTEEEVDRAFKAIEEVPGEEDRRWSAFLNLLLQGGPVGTLIDPETGDGVAYSVDDSGDEFVLFAFTSPAEAELWGAPLDQIKRPIPIDDLLAMAHADPKVTGIVVNPASSGICIDRDDMAKMYEYLSSLHRRSVPAGTAYSVGEPADYPQALVDDLAREAANHKAIKRMWLRQLNMNGESSYLVVVDGRKDEEVLRALGAVIRAHRELSQPVDIKMTPTKSMRDGFAGPFYGKKRRGLFG